MTFVLRQKGGKSLDLGPTLEVLAALGRIARLIGKDEEPRFREFLQIMGTDEEPMPADWIRKMLEQVEELKQRNVGEHRWLLDRLSKMRKKSPGHRGRGGGKGKPPRKRRP